MNENILVLIEKKRKQDGFKYVKIQLYAMCQRDDKVENNHQRNLYLTQMTYIVTLGTVFYTGDLYLTEKTISYTGDLYLTEGTSVL